MPFLTKIPPQYVPGDNLAWIDWAASARLSAVRDNDEFIVHEFFADEAPHVVMVDARRPSMGIGPSPLRRLDKPQALLECLRLIRESARVTRSLTAYLDQADVWIHDLGVAGRENDGDKVATIAHTLGSSSALLGAQPLADGLARAGRVARGGAGDLGRGQSVRSEERDSEARRIGRSVGRLRPVSKRRRTGAR